MDQRRLQELLRSETDRVEWKQSGKNADDVLHPACALANDLGGSGQEGFVLFGVNKHGKVTGIDTHGRHLDEIQQQTASRLTSTAIYPTPSFDLEAVEKSGKTVLVLRVLPYPVPPVVAVNAVAWVRKGTTTVRATDADLSRLRERRPDTARPFDTRCLPAKGLTPPVVWNGSTTGSSSATRADRSAAPAKVPSARTRTIVTHPSPRAWSSSVTFNNWVAVFGEPVWNWTETAALRSW